METAEIKNKIERDIVPFGVATVKINGDLNYEINITGFTNTLNNFNGVMAVIQNHIGTTHPKCSKLQVREGEFFMLATSALKF